MNSDSTHHEPPSPGGWGTPPWNPTPEPGPVTNPQVAPHGQGYGQVAVPPPAPAVVFRILSDTKFMGAWHLPVHGKYRFVLADVTMDLRYATLSGPVTTIELLVALTELKIVVPPGYRVELRVSSIVADVKFRRRSLWGKRDPLVQPAPDAPLIRIVGTATLSNVLVKYRHRETLP